MAKKPGPGRCVHCLKYATKRNWDHVFPVSWYPESTPDNLEKWKIPTCKPCNDRYGKIEEELGHVLSLCVDPDRIEAKGVYKRALRAHDPSHAKNEKDRKIREQKRRRLLQTIIKGEDIPTDGIYPGLGERWNRPRGEQTALTIPKRHVDQLGIKVVRGIAYIEDNRFIEDDYEIEPYAIPSDGAAFFEETIAYYGHSLSRGPGIHVDRALAADDYVASIYKVTIWGEFVIYLSVMPKGQDA